MEEEPFRLGSKGWAAVVSRAGLSSQLDRRLLAAVFVQHYVFTSMLSSHKSLRSLIMITFSVSFQPFEVSFGSFTLHSNLEKNEILKLFSWTRYKIAPVSSEAENVLDLEIVVQVSRLYISGLVPVKTSHWTLELHLNGFIQWQRR